MSHLHTKLEVSIFIRCRDKGMGSKI